MATTHKSPFNFSETRQQFEESKPAGGLRTRFLHKKNNSVDSGNLSSSFTPPISPPSVTTAVVAAPQLDRLQPNNQQGVPNKRRPVSLAYPRLQVETQPAIGQQWRPGGSVAIDSPCSPRKSFLHDMKASTHLDGPKSPTKSNLTSFSARFNKDKAPKELAVPHPEKISSSTTHLKGLLSRPKSNKNLRLATEGQDAPQTRNKENRKPSDPTESPITPIYAQFRRGPIAGAASVPASPREAPADPFTNPTLLNLNLNTNNSFRPPLAHQNSGSSSDTRRRSFQPTHSSNQDPTNMGEQTERRGRHKADESTGATQRGSTWARARSGSRARVLSALSTISGHKMKSNSPTPEPEPTNEHSSEPQFNPKDVDTHLEAMLDRRNIPENQRYKMRNLNSTIKMEFIRQDWAENEGKHLSRKPTNDSDDSGMGSGKGSVGESSEKPRSRGRTFTFSRNSWRIGTSPAKSKKKEGPMKGHSRNKSTDNVTHERPPSSNGSYSGSGILAKVTGQQPSDFVNYLRKVQKPENVEVGKLHKLRLLLRNERVAWTEDFIKQGGMKEIVGLLQRIMDVEWR